MNTWKNMKPSTRCWGYINNFDPKEGVGTIILRGIARKEPYPLVNFHVNRIIDPSLPKGIELIGHCVEFKLVVIEEGTDTESTSSKFASEITKAKILEYGCKGFSFYPLPVPEPDTPASP